MERYVVFRLGGDEFAIGVEVVVEILGAQKPSPVPEAQDYISGVITVRGVVTPVVDMRKRFGIASSPGRERIVLVRACKEKSA